jgi:alpha-tubulin suppressor-like RCC1 family protein
MHAARIDQLRNVVKICVGPSHSLALAEDPYQGDRVIPITKPNPQNMSDKDHEKEDLKKYVIYTWGSGWGGKLGHGNFENLYMPKMIQTKYTFKDISCGTNHSGAINAEDNIVVWGIGSYLGLTRPDEDDNTNI